MSLRKVSLRCVTPPASAPVTLEEAKAHLRVTFDDEDALISSLIVASTQALDGRAGWLYRCLMPQVWVAELDGFPTCGAIKLELGPVRSITSVKYYDLNGVDQTVAGGDYTFVKAEGLDDALIVPAFDKSWPDARVIPGSVRVTYAAGYESIAAVPDAVKTAILMDVADLYRLRESQSSQPAQANPASRRLLAPYRRMSL